MCFVHIYYCLKRNIYFLSHVYLILQHVLAVYSHFQVYIISAKIVSLCALFCVTCLYLRLTF
jgi:hypothetical protein